MNFKIRMARQEDANEITKVHVDVWRTTYRRIIPDHILDGLSYEQKAESNKAELLKSDSKSNFFVAEDDQEKVIGFVKCGPNRECNKNYEAEIYSIYLLKEFQGQGIGKSLLSHAARWLREQNYQSMLVWVLKDNPACKFYQALGGAELESKTVEIGFPLLRVSYGWSDIGSLTFWQPHLQTARFVLEPITERHTEELCQLLSDEELHRFIRFDAPTWDQQRERCAKWTSRKSPDGKELWLNWAARDKSNGKIVAHIQGGIQGEIASIGYMVGLAFQRKSVATECLEAIFEYFQNSLGVKEVKAWSDTRNQASHNLLYKLGFVQIETIKNADFFKGQTSDDFGFAKKLVDLKILPTSQTNNKTDQSHVTHEK